MIWIWPTDLQLRLRVPTVSFSSSVLSPQKLIHGPHPEVESDGPYFFQSDNDVSTAMHHEAKKTSRSLIILDIPIEYAPVAEAITRAPKNTDYFWSHDFTIKSEVPMDVPMSGDRCIVHLGMFKMFKGYDFFSPSWGTSIETHGTSPVKVRRSTWFPGIPLLDDQPFANWRVSSSTTI